MLQPLRSSIYAFKTDFVVAGWIARLRPDELEAAHTELARAGFPNPTIRSFDDAPLDIAALNRPVDVLMDVEPRNEQLKAFPGRGFDLHPILGPMLARAMTEMKPVASDPLPLLRSDGPIGLVLAAPVLQASAAQPAGFVTFSYELAPLMLANDDLSLFSVALKDPRNANSELTAKDRGIVVSRAIQQGPMPPVTRTVSFGDRDWTLSYYAKTNAMTRARQTAMIVGCNRSCADRDRLRAVRICRLQQPAAQPRNPGADRLRAAPDRGHRRAQSPRQEYPRGDPVDRDAHAASWFGHRRRPRTPDRPDSCHVECGFAAQRKPMAGREAEGIVRSARDTALRAHRDLGPRDHRQRAGGAIAVAVVLRAGVAFRRRSFAGRQASSHRRALGSDGRRARARFFIFAGKSSTPARRPAAPTAISASSCSTAWRRRRWAEHRSGTLPM